MNKIFLILFCMNIFLSDSFSQFKLEIVIQEISNNKGKIMLQLFDENEKLLTQEMGLIEGNSCIFSISDLKPGKYAVRYYHDENVNGKMETNLVGKPTEGYGFSNNVTGKFGPPPFAKWLFEVSEDKKIILKPTY
jgi:uncharacterized protein (DUF2141 family)